MKLSVHSRLRRRDFIRRLGGAAFALPCLELFDHEVRAQVGQKRSRFVVFLYTNDGVNNQTFWPTSADPTSSPTLNVLAPYKDKVLVLGPKLNAGLPMTDTGLTYAAGPAQHRASVTLSASKVSLPLNADQFRAVNKIDGPSIDWVIADALRKADGPNATPFPYLNFGIHPIGGDTPSEVNYDKNGQPIPRMSSADEVMKRLFGSLMPAPGTADNAGQLRKHTAVTDFLNARFNTIQRELSPSDQQILDQHLSSLRSFEERRAALLKQQTTPGATCTAPSAGMVPIDDTSVRTGADTQFLAPFFLQSLVTAFSCNMTRVASVSFGYPGGGGEGGLRMPWLGFTDAQHSVSHHGGNADKLKKYAAMNAWTVSQVKFLMDKLAATPAPGGMSGGMSGVTLLDQTTIYLFNRHGDGNAHTNFALPNVILGGTGGYFKTGQVLALPRTSPTQVLISIANAMGVDVKSFGSGAYADTTALAGITA
jgi:hypothetical protein